MIFDYEEEKQSAELWMADITEGTLSLEEIAVLAAKGITTCSSECVSRNIVGEDCCYCIRAIFPSNSHYQLFLKARNYFQRKLDVEVFETASAEAITGEKIGNTNTTQRIK